MRKKDQQHSADRTLQLLNIAAALAIQVEESAQRTQMILCAIVRAATVEMGEPQTQTGAGESSQANDALDDSLKDWLLGLLQDALSRGTSNEEFQAPCRKILDGMREAILSGNNLGAARAFDNYIRCMARPRPKVIASDS